MPARNFGHDLDAMLAAITPATRVVFIANPNNPGPAPSCPATSSRPFERVPEQVLVVLDEAYTECLAPAQRYDAIVWIERFPNLLVSRTFSKAYGLPACGWDMAWQSGSHRLAEPGCASLSTSVVGLAAAAAALFDDVFPRRSYELNQAGMKQLTDGFQRLGPGLDSVGGHPVTFKVGDGAGVNQRLLRQGVIVRAYRRLWHA